MCKSASPKRRARTARGDVRGLGGGTPEACLADRPQASSCGPCAQEAHAGTGVWWKLLSKANLPD